LRQRKPSVYIRIPYQTIIIVLLTVLFAKVMTTVLSLLLPLVLAILLAVAVMPLVRWLEKRGLHRSFAVGVTTIILALSIALVLYLIVPTVYDQISAFIEHFPQERDKLLASLGPKNPLREFIEKGLKENNLKSDPQNFNRLVGAGNYVINGLTETIVIFVFTIYLISDGPRMVEWLSAFFSKDVRHKIELTCTESSKIISAYVLGQVITSALSFAFVAVVLSLLNVPNVLLLASMAALFDVLPVLGFILAVVPAMLFALGISGSTSFIVLAAYLFYHGIENYFIVPLVYGNRLRVSSFVVFFGLLAAWAVAGIEGAIAILPIVASYPVVEKIWLTHIVRAEAIKDHERDLPELRESLTSDDPVYK
jgi:predicted PurR-regulated permease PerM